MPNFTDYGFVNTREMFLKAEKEHYAIPALYSISLEQTNAICDAIVAKRSPIIFLASPNLLKQLEGEMLARMIQGVIDRIHNAGLRLPVALHLDHGKSYEDCVKAIDCGFSSVMIDGSLLPFEENLALTKKVVEYAHKYDVSVEAELGILSGEEEGEGNVTKETKYTDPKKAIEFIRRSGCDSLAISIGTCHGLVKMKPDKDGKLPPLRYDILSEIETAIPGYPIVLHGSSNIDSKYVNMINEYGGRLEKTVGIPDEEIQKAATLGVAKVNIATDGWIAALANTRRILKEHPEAIDSRVFTIPNRKALYELYLHKIDILGSANRY